MQNEHSLCHPERAQASRTFAGRATCGERAKARILMSGISFKASISFVVKVTFDAEGYQNSKGDPNFAHGSLVSSRLACALLPETSASLRMTRLNEGSLICRSSLRCVILSERKRVELLRVEPHVASEQKREF